MKPGPLLSWSCCSKGAFWVIWAKSLRICLWLALPTSNALTKVIFISISCLNCRSLTISHLLLLHPLSMIPWHFFFYKMSSRVADHSCTLERSIFSYSSGFHWLFITQSLNQKRGLVPPSFLLPLVPSLLTGHPAYTTPEILQSRNNVPTIIS